jgi:type I restriction enzyme S subunit
MTVRLGDVVDIDRNGVDPAQLKREELYVGLEHVDSTGEISWGPSIGSADVKSTKFKFTPKHILFGKLRPYLRKVARPDRCGVCSTDILPLLPKAGMDRDFLFHILRTDEMINRATQACAGANLPRLSPEKFRAFEFRVPRSLPEQKRLAKILDKADEVRRKLQQSLRLSDDFLRSVFLDMFGDPVTNPKQWPVVPMSELGSLDRGVSKHRPRNEPALLGGPYPLIQTGDVANSGGYVRNHSSTYSELGLKQSKIWPKGTLCITIAANIANTGILTYDACFPDSVVGFTPNKRSTVEYVQSLIGSFRKILDDGASQVAQKNINLGVLRELMVPQPPRGMQDSFTTTVEKTNLLIGKTRLLAEEADAAFSSLQQRAFRGEL